jgi:TfoX/Sxy family transcriptional regulator of competence genes
MHVPRPTDDDKNNFRLLVADLPGVTVKAMFANLGAFINGNMFAGLFGSALGVKLTDAASRAELASVDGTGPYGPAERPMGGWISLPPTWSEDQALAREWIERALAESAELPPKAPKR